MERNIGSSKQELNQMTQDIINKSVRDARKSMDDDMRIDNLVARFSSTNREHFIQNFTKEETDVYYKRPSDIAQDPNEQKRSEDLYLFQLLDELYTTPLYEKANRISLERYQRPVVFSDLANVPIFARLLIIRSFLEANGVTLEEIKNLVPVKEEDFLVLADAYKKGFLLEDYAGVEDLSNENRVRRAKIHLEKQDSNDENKTK